MASKKTKIKCMTNKCENQTIYVRGLCRACYAGACRLVKQKEATWEELEDTGSCLPPAKSNFRAQWEGDQE